LDIYAREKTDFYLFYAVFEIYFVATKYIVD